ncbi:hypothetical protein F2Q68_00005981 [Brassica cretica]|uniref:Uncharacterized protein n=2 Tax=Brassica cretica TaxID=69181 RepID=A0ABQ7C6D7_BRACR|nr:hypothetical protein F2Q68_00005981 [Brassica cretica]KAF3547231.1 hypothetical protein DY000_02009207 [Brassica cretica]
MRSSFSSFVGMHTGSFLTGRFEDSSSYSSAIRLDLRSVLSEEAEEVTWIWELPAQGDLAGPPTALGAEPGEATV